MADSLEALILDLLEWLAPRPRPYAEVMDAWRTSCPQLPVWEDANERGLLERRRCGTGDTRVGLTPAGRELLRRERRVSTGATRPHVVVRPADPDDAEAWLQQRHALWPTEGDAHANDVAGYFGSGVPGLDRVLIASDGEVMAGFAELSIRPYAEGCDTRGVGFLEGWYVAPAYRQHGVGRSLVSAAEQWARSQGCREFASDAEPENELGRAAHLGCGFEEVGLVRCFRKSL